jgi:hypothetical protein
MWSLAEPDSAADTSSKPPLAPPSEGGEAPQLQPIIPAHASVENVRLAKGDDRGFFDRLGFDRRAKNLDRGLAVSAHAS